ncbi:hypothetical protein IVB36_18550 [Bradyrhizobium sp. 35]|uniref:DUF6894 family protein n=1 Tax=Bradyrhizobium sp. 35 TaxID=2782670 RepID=UPI001FFB6529|nr:hypothetical protein [Bradyrhizobium sp. 35]MCK1452848.1 hypothetical protein [Bradyrhizobium sp. 35]
MTESIDAVRAGDRKRAGELALSAYLEGFEPIEPALTASDRTLMERIEGLMGEYRAAVQGETADALSERVQVLDGLLKATRFAADLFRDIDGKLRPSQEWGLEVTDEAGTVVSKFVSARRKRNKDASCQSIAAAGIRKPAANASA